MKKRLFALSAALTLTTALTSTTFAGDPSQWGARKVNEYEGQHRKVNAYEGQHRASGMGETAKASPVLLLGDAAKKGSFDLAKKGSFDITERQTRDQLRAAAGGGTRPGEDVPVAPGIATGGGAGKANVQD